VAIDCEQCRLAIWDSDTLGAWAFGGFWAPLCHSWTTLPKGGDLSQITQGPSLILLQAISNSKSVINIMWGLGPRRSPDLQSGSLKVWPQDTSVHSEGYRATGPARICCGDAPSRPCGGGRDSECRRNLSGTVNGDSECSDPGARHSHGRSGCEFVPVIVTGTLRVPKPGRAAEVGLIEVSVGGGGFDHRERHS
jgi:hypothetical protein